MVACFVRSSHLDPCRSFPFYHRSVDQHIAAHKGSRAHNAWLDLSSTVLTKGTKCLVRPEFRQNFFSMFNFAQSLFVPQLSSVSNWHLFVLSQNCSSLHSFWVDIADSPYFVGFIFELGQTESGWQVFDPPLSSCLQTGFPFTPMQSKLEEQGTKNRGKKEINVC